MTVFQKSSVISWVCAERRMPAALTSTSSPPRALIAAPTCSRTDSSLEMSTFTVVRRSECPASFAVFSVCSRPVSEMSAATTVPPSARMRATVAWPIPDPAPLMRTRLSSNRFTRKLRSVGWTAVW